MIDEIMKHLKSTTPRSNGDRYLDYTAWALVWANVITGVVTYST